MIAVLLSILFKELPFYSLKNEASFKNKIKSERKISSDKRHGLTNGRSVCLLCPSVLGEHNSMRTSHFIAHTLLMGSFQGQLALCLEFGKGPLALPTYQQILMQTSYPNTVKYCTGPLVWVCLTGRIYIARFSARANFCLKLYKLFGYCLPCGLDTKASPSLFVSVCMYAHLQEQMIDFFPFLKKYQQNILLVASLKNNLNVFGICK